VRSDTNGQRYGSAVLMVFGLLLFTADTSAQVTMAWSAVGSAGNPAGMFGSGSVGYNYDIGTYDVTVSQYVDFLNAKDPMVANTLSLYNVQMSTPSLFGQIGHNNTAATGNRQPV
jgi:hypothetical protein